MVLAAYVWHYWIAVPLAVMSIVAVIAIAAAYLRKVTAIRYPRRPG